MSRWNTLGLRGSTLEELINMTNENYRQKKLAVIQKIPTPIVPLKFDSQTKNITQAYFDQKSTVDYIGTVQGIPVCFDAKETSSKSLPIQNIHPHQINFMREFEEQGGLSFLLVHFTLYGEYYLLGCDVLAELWEKAQSGGRKSITYTNFDKDFLIHNKSGYVIHYLEAVSKYLMKKEGNT